MNKSFSHTIEFSTHNYAELKKMGAQDSLVICPSFPALHPLADLFKESTIALGAQDCSPHVAGPYTGQVSALSLKEVGCRYCIIGHSESRAAFKESNELIAQKAERLLEIGLEPIICIGENKDAYHAQKAENVLSEQLESILITLSKFEKPFIIAYEPLWAIGTGVAANPAYVSKIFTWLKKTITTKIDRAQWRLLYGGSVDHGNIANLCTISELNGFLIGGASLDFQKLQKIVSLGK